MAFDFHPIYESGDTLRSGQWYVVSPEGSEHSPAPCQRVGACANYVKTESDANGRVLISAGAAPDGLCSDLYELLLTNDSHAWRKVHDGDLPSRYEHATFTLGSDLFVYAGAQTTGPLSDIWKYQSPPGRWTPVKGKGSIPPPRTYHSSTSFWNKDKGSGRLLVFSGGAVGTSPVRDRKVYQFDPATGEWTTPSTSGTPPTPRQGHIAAVVGNRMFVHGGMSGQQISNDLHVLNLTKWVWSNPKLRGVTSPSLAAHSCAVIGSKLYMFGGLTPAGAASDELYSLDTDHLTLEKIHITGPPPPARLDHAMCTIYLTTVTSISTGTTDSVQESCSTSSPTVDDKVTVAGRIQQTPNTVTVISPEGAENEDFSLISDTKSTSEKATLKEECTTYTKADSIGLSDQHLSQSSDTEAEPSESKPRTSDHSVASDNQATATEESSSNTLEKLSLSEEVTQTNDNQGLSTINKTPTIKVRDRSRNETVIVPALFVFGGMDTQGTIHGDSFMFVPQ